MRWCSAAAIAALAAACAGFASAASASVLLDGAGSHVMSYGGWSVWDRFDASTHKYALVARTPMGVIEQVAVAEREVPFEIKMGPQSTSSTTPAPVVVYPQCLPEGSSPAVPECTVYSVQLGVTPATGRAVLPITTAETDSPSPWRDELVYFSLAEHDNVQLLWQAGPGATSDVPLPKSRGTKSAVGLWPSGSATLGGLMMVSKNTILYSTRVTSGSFAMDGLWLQHLGANRRVLIDQATAGAGATCQQGFTQPV